MFVSVCVSVYKIKIIVLSDLCTYDYVCVCIYVSVCVYPMSVFVCVYLSVYVCVCIFMCFFVCVCVYKESIIVLSDLINGCEVGRLDTLLIILQIVSLFSNKQNQDRQTLDTLDHSTDSFPIQQ